MTRRAIGVLAVALVLGLAVPPRSARAYDASAQNKAVLILRILSYDHNLRMRAGDRVTVLVLHHAYEERSLRAREEIVGSLKQMQRVKVAGLPISIVSMPYSDAGGLQNRLAQTRPAAVFVCPGLEADVAAISAITRRASALTIATSEPDVRRGLSIAIVRRDGRDRIIINVAGARAEGARLDAGLLQLATIVGGTR